MKTAHAQHTRRIMAAALALALIAAAAVAAETVWRPDLRGTPLFDERGFHAAIGAVGAAVLIMLAALAAAINRLFTAHRAGTATDGEGADDTHQP